MNRRQLHCPVWVEEASVKITAPAALVSRHRQLEIEDRALLNTTGEVSA